jgi:hypothetical protein
MKGLLRRSGPLVVCLMVGSMLIHAQSDQMPVTIRLEGAVHDVKVAFLSTGGEKTFATASGADQFALASDLLDPNKRVEVWEVVCEDGTVVFILAPNAQLPPGCKGRRRLGVFLWKPGARFAGGDGGWFTSRTGLLTLSSAAAGGTFGAMKALGKSEAIPGKANVVPPAPRTTLSGTFTRLLNLGAGGACNASWRSTANVRLVVSENEALLIHVLPNGEVVFRHSPINREADQITGTGSAQVGNTTYFSQMRIGVAGSGNNQVPAGVSQQITYTNASNQAQCRIGYAE